MATADPTTRKAAGDGPLRCMVVTPERAVVDERADFVALPLFDGELGVAPGRAPLVGRLGAGELRVRSGGASHRYFIDGGFVQVRDDEVTLLTSRALPASEITVESAERALADAQAMPGRTPDAAEEKHHALRRARVLLRIARG